MMAFLGQWLGFDAEDDSRTKASSRPVSQPGIVISTSKSKKSGSSSGSQSETLRKTKSDELLRDFEVMRFLSRIDERIKEHEQLLSRTDLDRLNTLHAQAMMDRCTLLTDIIEHFELENDKLRFRLANAGPGSAAEDAMRSRRNMLVF